MDELTSLACEKIFFDEDTARGACAYSRAISVLNPIADAMHVVRGPLECATCATYAWNARGSISSQPMLHGKQDKIFFDNLGLSAQAMQDLACLLYTSDAADE